MNLLASYWCQFYSKLTVLVCDNLSIDCEGTHPSVPTRASISKLQGLNFRKNPINIFDTIQFRERIRNQLNGSLELGVGNYWIFREYGGAMLDVPISISECNHSSKILMHQMKNLMGVPLQWPDLNIWLQIRQKWARLYHFFFVVILV